LPPDIQDDIKPMNSSHEIIGGHVYKQIFVSTLMDVKTANELEFTETNLTHLYTLMRYPLNPGSIISSISSDHYRNPQDTTQYWSESDRFSKMILLTPIRDTLNAVENR